MRPVICIGAITRGRPLGFRTLIKSFAQMQRPPDADIIFAFVENDEAHNLAAEIEAFRASMPGIPVFYEIEPKLGIPMARNHVLAIALRERCNFLTFVDDDEIVAADWLLELYMEQKNRALDLVGGPVRLQPCPAGSSLIERTVWRGLVRRNKRIETTAARLRSQGKDHKVTVITSNWMACLSFVEQSHLRFDESLGFSGGSDTRFFKDAKKVGAQTGWAPRALVYEFMPTQRLSLAYQYRRGRDQAIASYRNKYRQTSFAAILKSLGFIVFKLISASALVVFSVFDGGASLVAAVRSVGFASGRTQAVFGRQSRQYETIQAA